MQTPNTRAGHITEKVMASVIKKLGRFPTHKYNATYSAVLEVMNEEFPEPRKSEFIGSDMNESERIAKLLACAASPITIMFPV